MAFEKWNLHAVRVPPVNEFIRFWGKRRSWDEGRWWRTSDRHFLLVEKTYKWEGLRTCVQEPKTGVRWGGRGVQMPPPEDKSKEPMGFWDWLWARLVREPVPRLPCYTPEKLNWMADIVFLVWYPCSPMVAKGLGVGEIHISSRLWALSFSNKHVILVLWLLPAKESKHLTSSLCWVFCYSSNKGLWASAIFVACQNK